MPDQAAPKPAEAPAAAPAAPAAPKVQYTVEGLARDIHNEYLARQARMPAAPAGVQMAPNLGRITQAIDAYAQKLQPLLDGLAPAQYRVILDAALALLHSVSNAIPAG